MRTVTAVSWTGPGQSLAQQLQLRHGGVADLEVAGLADEPLEVLDVRVPAHLAHQDLSDVTVALERLQPLGVPDPLRGLLADEEVAAAPHDVEEVLVLGVVGG